MINFNCKKNIRPLTIQDTASSCTAGQPSSETQAGQETALVNAMRSRGSQVARLVVLYAASFTSLLAGGHIVHMVLKPDLVSYLGSIISMLARERWYYLAMY